MGENSDLRVVKISFQYRGFIFSEVEAVLFSRVQQLKKKLNTLEVQENSTMKPWVLLELPLTGGLIEWFAVVLINTSLILFCAFSGLYYEVQKFMKEDGIAIILGPFLGFSVYVLFYAPLFQYAFKRRKAESWLLFAVRVANILYQIIHAMLFTALLELHSRVATIIAYWLYALIPVVLSICFLLVILFLAVTTQISEEYRYYKLQETQMDKQTDDVIVEV